MAVDDTLDGQLAAIKLAHETRKAEFNGNEYTYSEVPFAEGRAITAYFSSVQRQMAMGNFSFTETDEFKKIEDILAKRTLFGGMQVSKLPDHWGKNTADFYPWLSFTMLVFSHPFSRGVSGG